MSSIQWFEAGVWTLLGAMQIRVTVTELRQAKTLALMRERLDTHEQRQGVLAAIQGVKSQRITLLVSRVDAVYKRLGMTPPSPPIVETPDAAPLDLELTAQTRTTRETETS